MLAHRAGRRIRGQPARSRSPAAARRGGKEEVSKRSSGLSCTYSGKMKLHCEVEVICRQLPALGLRNRGRGVRAVLSLCQQTPRSQPRPRVGVETGGPRPACLLISTLKDKRGTRYELKENIEQFFTKFVDEGKATVRLKEPPVDIYLSKDSIWLSYHSFPSVPRFGYCKNLCLWKILSKLFHPRNYYHESTLCCSHCGPSR
ncbi:leucine-rich repeat protein 1 isoform X4 [Choloepus didactylus]|uniref:leucine-rich repeat protein 1 isoform X4 n=1 Tax=Choloepus didactylus TaxID=27675 RepID=UPI00189FBE7D|nr:leucine-rich repeat protein 1 isoform X4 [Choloepus didactylus]